MILNERIWYIIVSFSLKNIEMIICSLGWLRLLHHCLSLPSQDSELAAAVITSTASVSGLLEACCGLLLIPAPSPSLFTPNLERVLLKLGLHNRELGLKQINTLLRNGAAAFLQGMCVSLNPVNSVV
jgi:baculoviral IAP repeat-containing protein 6